MPNQEQYAFQIILSNVTLRLNAQGVYFYFSKESIYSIYSILKKGLN